MEPSCEAAAGDKQEACLRRTFSLLTVDDVYEIAKLVGSEVERLIDCYGKESAEGLVPRIVRVLELLESFAARNQAQRSREEELLAACEKLQAQQVQQKRKGTKDGEEVHGGELRQWQQQEGTWRRQVGELQAQVQNLREENEELLSQLRSTCSQEDRANRQEREVMLKLKEVVDKQRDEIRARVQEISTVSKEVEALQEQLDRFMKMNGELRHKQSIVQAQVKTATERKADLEADLREKQKEIERLAAQLEKAAGSNPSPTPPAVDLTNKMVIDLNDPNRPCFTKQEVRDMIFERNELKANLFLVQEELSYYQREILNDERCPGFLLGAVRSAIKKQRNIIKSKMLGIPVDQHSSDEEDKDPLFQKREVDSDADCTDSRPPESRISSLFGFLTRSTSAQKSPSKDSGSSAWEIISPEDTDHAVQTEPQGSP